MTYSEPLFNQISRFVTSIGFGFMVCALYFAVFFIRKIISDKRCAVIIQDILFGVIATVMSFFYMIIYNNGEVRMNLLIGEATGGLVIYYTIGRYILAVMTNAAHYINKVLVTAFLPLKIYVKAFKNCFASIRFKIKGKKSDKNKSKSCYEESGETVKKKTVKKIIKRKNIAQKPLKNRNKSV